MSAKNYIELIKMLEDAYRNHALESLNRIWLSPQSVMNKIIEERGDNKFKIPHMNKDRLERMDKLPVSIVVTPEANNYPLNTFVE
jgi:hypothetical protein